MTFHRIVRLLRGARGSLADPVGADTRAGAVPAAIALGRIVSSKGGIGVFDTIIDGVIAHHRQVLTQVNPNIDGDLSTIVPQLRTLYAPRLPQVHAEIGALTRCSSPRGSRQIVAFTGTPLGKKLIDAGPKAIDEATKRSTPGRPNSLTRL